MTETPILQFGTSRFLLAHADLFISEALARDEAIGLVTVVQTTGNPESLRRVAALNSGSPYPVRIQGLAAGQVIDTTVEGRAVSHALSASEDWPAVRRAALAARVILSNTGDRGFDLDAADTTESIRDRNRAPVSFPAKIAALLLERFERVPDQPVSLFPCELISRNGEKLKTMVRDLAQAFEFPADFFPFLETRCRFANSLVDRIVSEPLEPVGAVAEPYALWAVEAQEGLELPCTHPALVVAPSIWRYEALKLHILNLGHTVLADLWLSQGLGADVIVHQMMNDPMARRTLDVVWREEVLPVFGARGLGAEASDYIGAVRERFLNPFLRHRLSDIAGNHAEKKKRRLLPVIEMAAADGRGLEQPILRAILERDAAAI